MYNSKHVFHYVKIKAWYISSTFHVVKQRGVFFFFTVRLHSDPGRGNFAGEHGLARVDVQGHGVNDPADEFGTGRRVLRAQHHSSRGITQRSERGRSE